MKDKDHILAAEGVRFFGEMSASISHEIKNVLAIVNENAGLLQDLVLIHAKQGRALDPERLQRVATSLQRQVERGDRIARDLNRFSHSADAAVEQVDVVEMVQFMLRLGSRLIMVKEGDPVLEGGSQSQLALTNRFFLQRIFWGSLLRTLDQCRHHQTVRISVDAVEEKACIRFRGLSAEAFEAVKASFSNEEMLVAGALGIRIDTAGSPEQLCLTFLPYPKNHFERSLR